MRTVWTNGCFDIFHAGHVDLLSYARSLGDRLVVGIDSDERVRLTKGANRPINCQNDRRRILESQSSVDEVVIFDSTDSLIECIRSSDASIIVVGDDWQGKNVVGSDIVGSKNVLFFQRTRNLSTTGIIDASSEIPLSKFYERRFNSVVFDLDGTLCRQSVDGDYSTSYPIASRVRTLRKMHKRGCRITISTARGMGRFAGDVDAVRSEYSAMTHGQLREWGVPYDSLIFGKQSADAYVDDKGVHPNVFFGEDDDTRARSFDDILMRKDADPSIVHEKGWGSETWIANSQKYCGKILKFDAGKRCSWHYHALKTETFYLQSGELRVAYSVGDDLSSATVVAMLPGDRMEIPVGLRHQMTAVVDSELFEFSTQHFEDDSYRILKGD